MAQPQYLRQLETGRLYPYHKGIAARADMVPFDPEKAKIRLEATKAILEDSKAVKSPVKKAKAKQDAQEAAKIAKDLTDAENDLSAARQERLPDDADIKEQRSPEEAEADRKREMIENDSEIQTIKELESASAVAQYIRREYGEDADARKEDLETLKDRALNLRAERILEGDKVK